MRRKWLAPLGAALLAALGVSGAIALADTAGSSVCAGVTAATHTIAIDGNPVATVGGEASTTCVPVPTVTLVTTATSSPTTTSTQTGSQTYSSATSYTQNRPAFNPTREVDVTTGAGLKSAVANLQPGDLVKATADFTLSSSTNNALVFNKKLSSPAVIDLSEHTVKIVYNGTGASNAVWFAGASNLRIYGGDVSTDPTDGPSGSACINMIGASNVLWWGFKAHDCGADGLAMFTGANPTKYPYVGPMQNDDIEGDISRINYNYLALDPHAEKGSGLHGANLADTNAFAFANNRVALNVHDVKWLGGGIEFGSDTATPLPTNNTIILECSNFSFISTSQTGGNCFQTWGYGILNTDIQYLHATNITGYAYLADDGSMYGSGQTGKLATNTVELGRADGTNKNPRFAGDPSFSTFDGTKFLDATCVNPATPCVGVARK